MNMPLGAARPPGTATVDGAPAGANGSGANASGAAGPGAGRPERAGGGTGDDGTGGDADSGTDGRVDGTAQEPSGPYLGGNDEDGVLGSAEWDLLTDGVHWNAETYLLLGCDPDHGPLSLDRLPDRLPEADRPLLRRMMTDALVHGRVAAGTLRIRRPGGRHDNVECSGEPVLGTDGTVTALRMLLRPAPPD
ncbi:PAS domain-containing protein [Kitasatospora sp. NPDC097691]|uniref:PAS domain-containing protein n=1 Tax=Kitasatospora sp. NPDC097691 TaxID=3157231 RepID=UPI0033192EF8